MGELLDRLTHPDRKTVYTLIIFAIVLFSLVPGSVLAQEGTSIPGGTSILGSGNGTSQPAGTTGANATNSSNSSQGSGSGDCSGVVGCSVSSANHVKNGYISTYQGTYNFLNPLNTKNGSAEFNESKSQFGQAGEDAGQAADDAIPGPFEMFIEMVDKFVSGITNFVVNMVNGILWSMFALPAPGQAFDPGTWYTAGTAPLSDNSSGNLSAASAAGSNGTNSTANITAIQPMVEGGGVDRSVLPAGLDFDAWWAVVWKVYAGLAALAAMIVVATGVFTLSGNSQTPRERNQRLRDLGIALGMVLFGPILLPAALHFGNIIAAGLAPNATELLNSPENILKVGDTVGFAILGYYFASTSLAIVLLVSTIIAFAQWILTFFVAATYIIWAPLYGSQNATLKAWSRMGFGALGILIGLKIVQTLLFRILWMLPLSWSDPAESIVTLLVFPIGLYVIFYKIPRYALSKAVPTFVSTVGGSSGGHSVDIDNSTRNFNHELNPRTNNPSGSGGGAASATGGGGGGGSDRGLPAASNGGGGGGGGGGYDSNAVAFLAGAVAASDSGRARKRGGGGHEAGGGSDPIDVESKELTNNPGPGASSSAASSEAEPTPLRPPSQQSSTTPEQNPSENDVAEMVDSGGTEAQGGTAGTRQPPAGSEMPESLQNDIFESRGSARAQPRDVQTDTDGSGSPETVDEVEGRNVASQRREGTTPGAEGAPSYDSAVGEEDPYEPFESVFEDGESQRTRTRGDQPAPETTNEVAGQDRPSQGSPGGSPGSEEMPAEFRDLVERRENEAANIEGEQSTTETGRAQTRDRSGGGTERDGLNGEVENRPSNNEVNIDSSVTENHLAAEGGGGSAGSSSGSEGRARGRGDSGSGGSSGSSGGGGE